MFAATPSGWSYISRHYLKLSSSVEDLGTLSSFKVLQLTTTNLSQKAAAQFFLLCKDCK